VQVLRVCLADHASAALADNASAALEGLRQGAGVSCPRQVGTFYVGARMEDDREWTPASRSASSTRCSGGGVAQTGTKVCRWCNSEEFDSGDDDICINCGHMFDEDCPQPRSPAAGSSRAGADAAGSAAAAREKKKKPKPKKRTSSGDGAMQQKAKKRSKTSKAKVRATWTDSEDDATPANSGAAAAAAQPGISWATWVKKPPPTISFASNVAQEPPVYWAMKKGGSEAANLLDSMGGFAHEHVCLHRPLPMSMSPLISLSDASR